MYGIKSYSNLTAAHNYITNCTPGSSYLNNYFFDAGTYSTPAHAITYDYAQDSHGVIFDTQNAAATVSGHYTKEGINTDGSFTGYTSPLTAAGNKGWTYSECFP